MFDLLNMGEPVRTGSSSVRLNASSATLNNAAAKSGITEVALALLDRPDEFCSRVCQQLLKAVLAPLNKILGGLHHTKSTIMRNVKLGRYDCFY